MTASRCWEDNPAIITRRFRIVQPTPRRPNPPPPARPAPSLKHVTDRQRECLAIVCAEGEEAAAARLGIAARTVKWLCGTALHNAHAGSRAEACRLIEGEGR